MNRDQALITHPSQESGSWGVILTLAAQHVIVLFSGIILVPVMLVNIHGISEEAAHYFICVTALCAAAATLLQLVKRHRFGLGAPMFMGTSGVFLTCAHSALELGGIPLLMGMVLIAAPFQIVFSYLIRFMRHILTPTVGGVIIMLAVVGLLKDSVITWGISGHTVGWPAMQDILTGGVTICIMLAVEWFGGRKLRHWALAFGIMAGTMVAAISGLPVIEEMGAAPWFGFPVGAHWPGIAFSFSDAGHWTMTLTFVLAVLGTSVKYTGDAMLLQKVVEPHQRKVDYDALQGGLYANSVGMLLAGLAGGMPSSSHSANIPLMELTGVATRRLAVVAALLLAAVALSPKALLLLVHIPSPVIGGVGVVLVAHLFSSGVQLMAADLDHQNGLIAGLALCSGLIASGGLFFPHAFPPALDPLVKNGVALGGLVAVLLTLIMRLGSGRRHSIRLEPTIEQLPFFKKRLFHVANQLDLDARDTGYLELACEEVFLFMREELRSIESRCEVAFSFRKGEQGVFVEVSGQAQLTNDAEDVAPPDFSCLDTCSESDLNSLGLFLLGRISSSVSHVTISGYTYIAFSLPIPVAEGGTTSLAQKGKNSVGS